MRGLVGGPGLSGLVVHTRTSLGQLFPSTLEAVSYNTTGKTLTCFTYHVLKKWQFFFTKTRSRHLKIHTEISSTSPSQTADLQVFPLWGAYFLDSQLLTVTNKTIRWVLAKGIFTLPRRPKTSMLLHSSYCFVGKNLGEGKAGKNQRTYLRVGQCHLVEKCQQYTYLCSPSRHQTASIC